MFSWYIYIIFEVIDALSIPKNINCPAMQLYKCKLYGTVYVFDRLFG